MAPEDKNREAIETAQQAYETCHNVDRYINKATKSIRLTTIFGMAAGIALMAAVPDHTVPYLLINGSFLYSAYKRRDTGMSVQEIFNEVAGGLKPEAQKELRPLAKVIGEAEPISGQDLNLFKHLRQNPALTLFSLAMSALAPALIPGMLGMLVSDNDDKQLTRTRHVAQAVARYLDYTHPNRLKKPEAPKP